jgi:O-antigen/teichoic acid export membrane protein
VNLRRAFTRDPVSHSLGIVGVLSILQRVIGIARGIIFTRALGPAGVGVYTLTAFILSVGIPVVSVGLPSSYGRYVPRYEANRSLRAFVRVTMLVSALLTCGFIAASLVWARPLARLLLGDERHVWALRITALTLLPAVLHRNLSSLFKGLLSFRLSSLLEFAYLALFTVLGVVGVLLWRGTLATVLWANFFAYLVPVAVFGALTWWYVASLPDQKPSVDEERFARKMFAFCIWFVIVPSGLTLFDYVDRLMLNHFLDEATVGIYSTAFNTTAFLLAVGYVPNLVLGPTLSAAWEQHDMHRVQHTFNLALKLMLLLMLGASLVLVLLRNWVLVFLYGGEYASGAIVMAPLLAFQCFDVTYTIAGMYSGLIEKTYLPAIAVGGGLAANIGLNLVLIPRFGMLGAAYAAMSSYALINVLLYALNRRTGLVLDRGAIAVCLLPFSLLLPPPLLVVVAGLVLAALLGTNAILDRSEKQEALRNVRRLARLPLGLVWRERPAA